MDTIRLTTAQALVRFLCQQYSQRDGHGQRLFAGMFGIFGHGNVTGLGQALDEDGHDLRYYRAQNEQAMVHTAVAYAKMKNRLQTFACTSSVGPGATNMVTGAAGATINRLPVLLLPGDIFASRLPHPVLQQLEHPGSQDISVNDCFRPVSRYWDRINRPEQLLSSLPEAMRVLTNPAETGAVTIALPEDVQTEAYDYPTSFFAKRVYTVPRSLPESDEIHAAATLLAAAKRPLVIAGGGVIYSEASDALAAFAEAQGIPVCESQAGKGALPWDHHWNVGPVGANGGLAANRLAAQADVVVAIGTRLGDFVTASRTAFQAAGVRFIALNVTAADAHKFGALPLVGDARAGINALADALSLLGRRPDPAYQEDVRMLIAEWTDAVESQRRVQRPEALTQANVIGIVNEASRPRDVVVCAAGGLPGDLLKLWRPSDPKGYHVEYGYSCMGYEIAGGLGVKMAEPGRDVYVMVGDGSYLMMHTEIVTAIQEHLKLTIVLLDNNGYQCIRGLQMAAGASAFGNELRYRDEQTGRLDGPFIPVDFARNAESLGAMSYTATSESELREALERAASESGTTLIYVPVDSEARVPSYESWWDVPVAEISTRPGVQTAREDYEQARTKRRYFSSNEPS
ncbi:MAG: 3D-(3,5/4)-trihydroxycyclohexane-1,2-dione acylhydrolase (decyclizing) [Chloroflexota bacterium]|nr:3D-(3,5/4)-trihydroxycyclohexane-1,2-dione acylhydrolase (decyclizing) [Chloroflexota bacterium]